MGAYVALSNPGLKMQLATTAIVLSPDQLTATMVRPLVRNISAGCSRVGLPLSSDWRAGCLALQASLSCV